jgi:hypothetical protein
MKAFSYQSSVCPIKQGTYDLVCSLLIKMEVLVDLNTQMWKWLHKTWCIARKLFQCQNKLSHSFNSSNGIHKTLNIFVCFLHQCISNRQFSRWFQLFFIISFVLPTEVTTGWHFFLMTLEQFSSNTPCLMESFSHLSIKVDQYFHLN